MLAKIEFIGNRLSVVLRLPTLSWGDPADPLGGSLLALHLGPRTFVFRYDDLSPIDNIIDFYDHGLTWSAGDTVDVRLARLSPPGTPTDVAAAARGRDTIDLSWQRPASDGGAPLTGYRIEVSEDEGLTWSDLVAAAPPTAISYSHAGLVGGSERHYRVSAINAAGTSDPSGSASDTTDFIHHAAPAGIPGTVVYSAILTAGTADHFGTSYTGYNSGNGSGSLSPAEFNHGGHSRTFGFLAFAGSNLVASLGAVSSDDPLAGSLVVLHLGPRAFPFAFDDILDDGRVDFSPHGLAWLAGDTADVRLALLSSPGSPDRARGHRPRPGNHPARLGRAGQRRRDRHHGLPDRGVARRQLRLLVRPRRQHRLPRHHLYP